MTDNHVAPLHLCHIMRSKAISLGWQAHPQRHKGRKKGEEMEKMWWRSIVQNKYNKADKLTFHKNIRLIQKHYNCNSWPKSAKIKKICFQKKLQRAEYIMVWISNRHLHAEEEKKCLDKAVWDMYNHSSNRIPGKRTPCAFREMRSFLGTPEQCNNTFSHMHSLLLTPTYSHVHKGHKHAHKHAQWKTDCVVLVK